MNRPVECSPGPGVVRFQVVEAPERGKSFMADSSHTIRDELSGVAGFVGSIWAIFFLSWAFPAIDHYGVVPRTAIGLVGIPAMPFLHANLHHLISNTIPLLVLLFLLAGSCAESWEVVALIALLGGFLLWVFGRPAVHIGASGLISGLTAFLILSGVLEHRIIPLLIAILVGFLYGGSLIVGVLPHFNSNVSWDGHLCWRDRRRSGGVCPGEGLPRGARSKFAAQPERRAGGESGKMGSMLARGRGSVGRRLRLKVDQNAADGLLANVQDRELDAVAAEFLAIFGKPAQCVQH